MNAQKEYVKRLVDIFFNLCQVCRESDDKQHFYELGRLEIEETEFDPDL